MLEPIRCVQFTNAVLRHANIRDQKPSLGIICPVDPHQRNPDAPKFEDRSQEETERQERYARGAAWKMARCILKVKEKHKNNILLTFGELVSTFAINNKTRGHGFCCGLRCVDAHDQQKGFEFR